MIALAVVMPQNIGADNSSSLRLDGLPGVSTNGISANLDAEDSAEANVPGLNSPWANW